MDNVHDISIYGEISRQTVSVQTQKGAEVSGQIDNDVNVEGETAQRKPINGASKMRVPIYGEINIGKK